MSQVINQSGFVPDQWQNSIVPELSEYDGGFAVQLDVSADISALKDHLDSLKLIVIPFGSSADGRGFSLAAELRDMGFAEHLRARGHILVDQMRAAFRSGFDDLEISDAQAKRNPEHQWLGVRLGASYRQILLSA